jgi:glutamate---cysteine ligase / carboxylate-amine ligase
MATTSRTHEPPHRFGIGPSLGLGVEEELLVVDPCTFQATSAADLGSTGRRWSIGEVRPELCDAMIELITPICAQAGEAADVLRTLRGEVIATGATLIGAGAHPEHEFGSAAAARGRRYAEIDAMLRGLWRRMPYCGMHVHVGMPDPETAVRAANGMRKWVPALIALGANSPFWHGRDSGLASTRAALLRSFPRTGVPRAFTSYADFLETVARITTAGALDDYTTIWWDLRLHPRLGTLEVRVPDAQSSLEDAAALAALIHCLVIHEAHAWSREADEPSSEELDECSFRAMRDGTGATLHFEGTMQPLGTIVRTALDRVRPVGRDLNCAADLRHVLRMLSAGNGADRQRRAFERGGIEPVLRHLAWETRLVREGDERAAAAAEMGSRQLRSGRLRRSPERSDGRAAGVRDPAQTAGARP